MIDNDDKTKVLTRMRIAISKLETAIERDITAMAREMSIRFEQADKALTLQAQEYERRLEILNHEAAQLKEMQANYVPRETHKLLETKVGALELHRERQQGERSRVVLIAIASAIIAIASVVVNIIK